MTGTKALLLRRQGHGRALRQLQLRRRPAYPGVRHSYPATAENPAGLVEQGPGGRADSVGATPNTLEATPSCVPVAKPRGTGDADGVGSNPITPDAEPVPEASVRASSPARSVLPVRFACPADETIFQVQARANLRQ